MKLLIENQPEKIRQVITSDTSAKVRDAMEGL